MPDTDRIERKAVLKAPRSRVWRALANAEEFGTWFGVKLEGAFVEGEAIRGKITYPGYEHLTMEMRVERIPLGRRAEAFRRSGEGWSGQMVRIERHVAQT